MNNNTQNTQITVFYGDQPAHAHERRAINVVRNELARRGISATLLVNFTIRSRQIDLLIVTEQRCMNVELKHVDVTLPLIAKPNGLWRQQLPDGTERMLDRNYYEQARQETYALSDLLEKLARKRLVPGPQHSGFAKHIDTVVCCDPHIPAGSALTKHPHVAVVGLDTLLDRLAQPGPGFPHWAPQHWEEAIRCLGLYPRARTLRMLCAGAPTPPPSRITAAISGSSRLTVYLASSRPQRSSTARRRLSMPRRWPTSSPPGTSGWCSRAKAARAKLIWPSTPP